MPTKTRPSKKHAPRRHRTQSRPRSIVIAIDGPAGSGKSTVAAGVAKALGLRRLHTRALYPAPTPKALRRGVEPRGPKRMAEPPRRDPFSPPDPGVPPRGRRGALPGGVGLDRSRSVSPMTPAEGALLLDSTGKTPRRVVAEIVREARGLPSAKTPPTKKGSRRASRGR